jgi:hypothetical protein
MMPRGADTHEADSFSTNFFLPRSPARREHPVIDWPRVPSPKPAQHSAGVGLAVGRRRMSGRPVAGRVAQEHGAGAPRARPGSGVSQGEGVDGGSHRRRSLLPQARIVPAVAPRVGRPTRNAGRGCFLRIEQCTARRLDVACMKQIRRRATPTVVKQTKREIKEVFVRYKVVVNPSPGRRAVRLGDLRGRGRREGPSRVRPPVRVLRLVEDHQFRNLCCRSRDDDRGRDGCAEQRRTAAAEFQGLGESSRDQPRDPLPTGEPRATSSTW